MAADEKNIPLSQILRFRPLDRPAAVRAAMAKVIRQAALAKVPMQDAQRLVAMLDKLHKRLMAEEVLGLEQRKMDLVGRGGAVVPFMGFAIVPPAERAGEVIEGEAEEVEDAG